MRIPGFYDAVRPPTSLRPGQGHRREIETEDIRDTDGGGAEEARDEHCAAADRPHDQRLQQPPFGIAPDDAEREEDREHDAEEERPEHRHPEQEGTRERVCIDPLGRHDAGNVPERVAIADPVQRDEGDGEQTDDDEHLPPQRLAQAVARDRQRRGHSVSPPTAST